jgi:hypothetical protein
VNPIEQAAIAAAQPPTPPPQMSTSHESSRISVAYRLPPVGGKW